MSLDLHRSWKKIPLSENHKKRKHVKIGADKLLQIYKFRNVAAFQPAVFNTFSILKIEGKEGYHPSAHQRFSPVMIFRVSHELKISRGLSIFMDEEEDEGSEGTET